MADEGNPENNNEDPVTDGQAEQDPVQHTGDESAYEVGGVATSGGGIKVAGSDSGEELPSYEHPTGNPDSTVPRKNNALAWEMAHEEQPIRDTISLMKKNLESEGRISQEDALYIRELKENAKQKAEDAKAEYFAQREYQKREEAEEAERKREEDLQFDILRESARDRLFSVVSKELEATHEDPVSLLWVDAESLDKEDPYATADTDYFGANGGEVVSPEHLYELREALYKLIGAEPPGSDKFQYTGEHYPPVTIRDRFLNWFDGPGGAAGVKTDLEARLVTPGNMGFSIIEKRNAWLWPGKNSRGPKSRETDITEVKTFGLWVVPSAESAEEPEDIAA